MFLARSILLITHHWYTANGTVCALKVLAPPQIVQCLAHTYVINMKRIINYLSMIHINGKWQCTCPEGLGPTTDWTNNKSLTQTCLPCLQLIINKLQMLPHVPLRVLIPTQAIQLLDPHVHVSDWRKMQVHVPRWHIPPAHAVQLWSPNGRCYNTWTVN